MHNTKLVSALPAEFQSATIILPAINETVSLERTVEIILRGLSDQLQAILIVVCDRTTTESMATVNRIVALHSGLITVHKQLLPYLGGAIREAFDLARSSHTVIMASDMETDPTDLPQMIAEARRNPRAIIAASRWLRRGSFSGYSPAKLVLNWIFQSFFSLLYGVRLTDMTFAYRVYPTAVVQSIRWEELRHPFLFECLIKPLRLGIPVIEVSSSWQARTEGESQNTFMRNFVYFRTGFKTRIASRASILKQNSALSGPTPQH